jgi:hypothetical protein
MVNTLETILINALVALADHLNHDQISPTLREAAEELLNLVTARQDAEADEPADQVPPEPAEPAEPKARARKLVKDSPQA